MSPIQRIHGDQLLAMFEAGRISETCANSHLRTWDNTWLTRKRNGFRVVCAVCEAETRRMRREQAATPRVGGRLRTGYAAGEWASVALCQDLPSPLVLNTKLEAEDETFMARTCAACPVAQQCAEWAEDQPYFEGVAAGVIYAPGSRRPLRELEVSAA